MRLGSTIAFGLLIVMPSTLHAAEQSMTDAQGLFERIPAEPPTLEGNPLKPEKVELGIMLYFETRLSESHTISCNSCHVVGMGGVDALETSLGHRWQAGGRNAPTVLNSVFNAALTGEQPEVTYPDPAAFGGRDTAPAAVTAASGILRLERRAGHALRRVPGSPQPREHPRATADRRPACDTNVS